MDESLMGKYGKDSAGEQEDKSKPVRKSQRVPKRRALDLAFDDEEEDDEIRYLERLKTSMSISGCKDDAGESIRRHQELSRVSDIGGLMANTIKIREFVDYQGRAKEERYLDQIKHLLMKIMKEKVVILIMSFKVGGTKGNHLMPLHAVKLWVSQLVSELFRQAKIILLHLIQAYNSQMDCRLPHPENKKRNLQKLNKIKRKLRQHKGVQWSARKQLKKLRLKLLKYLVKNLEGGNGKNKRRS